MSGDGSLGALVISVETDMASFQSDMGSVASLTKSAMDQVQSSSSGAGAAVAQFTDTISTANDAAKNSINAMLGLSDAEDKVSYAGQRMIAQLQQEIATFGMTRDELDLYKASMAGVGDQYAQLQNRLQSMRDAQSLFSAQIDMASSSAMNSVGAMTALAESEAQAASRIRDMVAASVAETSAIQQGNTVAAQAVVTQSTLSSSTQRAADASRGWQMNMAGVAASMKMTTDQTQGLSAATQQILARYDPLGTKLRSLQSDLATLRKEMGDSTSNAAMKAFQGLEDEIGKTQKLMATAGAEGFDAMSGAANRNSLATAGATRELITLGHEALTGNFSRMPGSFMVLAERMGSVTSLLNPVTIGIVALSAAAVGVVAAFQASHDEFVAINNALLITRNYAGMSRDSIVDLAQSMSATGEITIGTAKGIATQLVASGQIGADSMKTVAGLAKDYAKATGQDVDEIAPKLVSLFADPTKGASELNSSMHFLTTTTLEQIATYQRLGDVEGAQLLLAQRLAEQIPSQTENVTALGRAYNAVYNEFAKFKQLTDEAMHGQSLDQQIADAKEAIEMIKGGGDLEAEGIQKALKYQQDLVASLEDEKRIVKEITDAEADATKENQKQAKSWEAIAQASSLYHIQALKDQEELIKAHKSDPGQDFAKQEAAKRDALYQTQKQIEDGYRAMASEAIQETQERITSEQNLRDMALKGQADELDYQLKIGNISQLQYDAQKTANAEAMNESKQLFDRQMMQIAGLTAAERQRYADDLKLQQALWDNIEQNGVNKALADQQAAYDAVEQSIVSAGTKELQSLQDAIDKQKEHNAEIGKTPAQIELVKRALDEQRTIQISLHAQELQREIDNNQYAPQELANLQLELNYLNKQVDLRNQLAKSLSDGAIAQADADAAKAAFEAWKKTDNLIQNDLTSAIVDGGGNGLKKLILDMEKAFARMVLQPIISPIAAYGASLFNSNASQAASLLGSFDSSSSGGSSGGSGGAGMSTVSLLQAGKTIYDGFSAGFSGLSTTVGGYISSIGNTLGSSTIADFGSGMQGYSSISSYGSSSLGAGNMVGSVGPWAAIIAAAMMYDSSLYAKGWQIENGMNNVTPMGTALLGGPANGVASLFNPVGTVNISDRIGQAFGLSPSTASLLSGSSVIARMFGNGPKLQDSTGISGTFTAAGLADAQAYSNWSESGGWFSSSKHGTDYAPLDATTTQQYTDEMNALKAATDAAAKAFGLSTTAVDNYTHSFNLLFTNDQAANQQKVTQLFTDMSNEMANDLVPNLSHFAQSGEAAAQTLQRLASDYTGVDQVLATLGTTSQQAFGAVGLASMDLRESLISLAGGLSNLESETTFFASNFETAAEQVAPIQANVTKQMTALGYASVTTITQFDALVHSLDLSTTAGQQAYAALMALAPAFKQVADYNTQLLQQTVQAAQQNAQNLAAAEQTAQQAVDTARSNLTDAYNAQASSINAVITQAMNFEKTMKQLQQSLYAGSLSPLSPMQNVAQLHDVFNSTLTAAEGGDTTAQGQLQSTMQAYLQADQALAPSAQAYAQDVAKVNDQLNKGIGLTDKQLTVAEQQLAALNAEVGGLININNSVMTVGDAVSALQGAVNNLAAATNAAAAAQIAAANAASGGGPQTATEAGAVAFEQAHGENANGDYASYFSDWSAYVVDNLGLKGVTGILAPPAPAGSVKTYASGGEFGGGLRVVGENGPELEFTGPSRISNFADIMARISSPQLNSKALLDEIKALRADQRAQAAAIASASAATARIIKRWEGNGMPNNRGY